MSCEATLADLQQTFNDTSSWRLCPHRRTGAGSGV